MGRSITLLASMVAVLALGACSPVGTISMHGSYAVTMVVTQTNTPGTTVGDVSAFAATITVNGHQVEMSSLNGFEVNGTRDGNSVLLATADGAADAWTFDLTWTSETDFEGESRYEDGIAGTEYVEFDVRGFASPYLAGE